MKSSTMRRPGTVSSNASRVVSQSSSTMARRSSSWRMRVVMSSRARAMRDRRSAPSMLVRARAADAALASLMWRSRNTSTERWAALAMAATATSAAATRWPRCMSRFQYANSSSSLIRTRPGSSSIRLFTAWMTTSDSSTADRRARSTRTPWDAPAVRVRGAAWAGSASSSRGTASPKYCRWSSSGDPPGIEAAASDIASRLRAARPRKRPMSALPWVSTSAPPPSRSNRLRKPFSSSQLLMPQLSGDSTPGMVSAIPAVVYVVASPHEKSNPSSVRDASTTVVIGRAWTR